MTEVKGLEKVRGFTDAAKKDDIDAFDIIISKNSDYNDKDPDLEMFSVLCSGVVVCGDYIISTNVEDVDSSMERLGSILGKAALCQYAKIINYDIKGEIVDSNEFKIRYTGSGVGYNAVDTLIRRTFMFQIIR